MATTLYLAGVGPESGKSAIALAVLDAMARRTGRVAVFRPVVRAGGTDPLLRLLVARLPAGPSPEECQGVTYDEVHADTAGCLQTIIERFDRVADGHDAVLVVGTDYTDVGAATELAFNGRVAMDLGAPVLLVVSGRGRTVSEIVGAAEASRHGLAEVGCTVLGTVANQVAPGDVEAVRTALAAAHAGVAAVPHLPLLSAPLVGQLFQATGAELIAGSSARLDGEVLAVLVAAMTLPNVLVDLTEGALVIVPGDRADALVGVLTAHRSATFPPLSGVLLTGGLDPEPAVLHLLEGLRAGVPMAATPLATFPAATIASTTHGALTDAPPRTVEAALALVSEHIDGEALLRGLDLSRSEAVTPLMFEHDLVVRARSDRRTIVLPEGDEPRVLRAAAEVLRRQVADLVLLGDPGAVRAAAALAGADIGAAQILDPQAEPLRHELAEELLRRRAHKGMTMDAALDRVIDPNYAGTLLVALGRADGMVSGANHTTAQTIRPAFEVIRASPGRSVVSSTFFMCLADRVLCYADCAIVPNPTADELADIAIASAGTAEAFGVHPRVAMLSYSTGESGEGADVDKVRTATRLVRERAPGVQVEGPIQYDAAIDVGVARTKLPGSGVAGHATVFVFPDLNTGNNTYKAVQRSAGAVAVGPVLQGLRRPVNDLSRGATVRDIVTTIAITAVQAQAAPRGVPLDGEDG